MLQLLPITLPAYQNPLCTHREARPTASAKFCHLLYVRVPVLFRTLHKKADCPSASQGRRVQSAAHFNTAGYCLAAIKINPACHAHPPYFRREQQTAAPERLRPAAPRGPPMRTPPADGSFRRAPRIRCRRGSALCRPIRQAPSVPEAAARSR